MFLSARKLKEKTDIANDNNSTEFWGNFKVELFKKMKDRSDKGYYSLSIIADEDDNTLENVWIFDNNLSNRVIHELKKLGYSLSYDRYRGFIEISWK